MTSVVYLGDGDVGEAVIYGLPFIVGKPVELPEGFEFAGKILANPTFAVVEASEVESEGAPMTQEAPKRRGRPPRAR